MKDAGVASPTELARVGAVSDWGSVYRMDPSFPPKWVYSFEAVIEGVPVKEIDPETKKRLKIEVEALVTESRHAAWGSVFAVG